MGIIVVLLTASLLLGGLFLLLFVRAVRAGQYEDTVTPAMRILAEEDTVQGKEMTADPVSKEKKHA